MKFIKTHLGQSLINAIGLITIIIFVAPIIMSFLLSIMNQFDIGVINKTITSGKQLSLTSLIPKVPSLRQFFIVLLQRADYLNYFWNSCKIVFPIVIGQVILGSLGAYGFTFFEFRFKKIWFTLYIIAMLLPFQVTLVPNFIVAVKSGLLGKFASIYIPGIFSAYGIFFLHQFMKTIPKSLIEAAQIDGAGHLKILTRIVMPISKPFILSLVVLTFIDNWNLVEQPLVMLTEKSSKPLSLILASSATKDFQIAFAASVIYLIPPLLLYFATREHLQSGLKDMSLK